MAAVEWRSQSRLEFFNGVLPPGNWWEPFDDARYWGNRLHSANGVSDWGLAIIEHTNRTPKSGFASKEYTRINSLVTPIPHPRYSLRRP